MVTFNKVSEILKTLPIGYYLGAKLDCELKDEDVSYFDPMNNQIIIGYKQLPLASLTENDPEVEDNIRCMLYHEISHAILTPKDLQMTDVLNIFEDQRIETLLKSFYHRVNFEGFVRKVNNHFTPTQPMSADEYYYNIIRYGEGPVKFVTRRDKIISDYASLNKNSICWTTNGYEAKVNELYKDIVNDFNQQQANQPQQNSSNKPSENMEASQSNNSDNTTQQNVQSEQQNIPVVNNVDDEYIKSIVANTIQKVINQYKNDKLKNIFQTMIQNAQKKKSMQAGALTGYSGKINPKLINRPGKIETYKWWEKSNVNGDTKRYSKIQLNLFCDCSGSFNDSEVKANEIIKALIDVERINKDFSFKLVTMNDNTILAKNNERELKCSGCNCLTNEIIDIYKSLQTPNTMIYNIVLFDGEAQNVCPWGMTYSEYLTQHRDAFKAWNHPNCIIISDKSNQISFERCCPNAKRIYTKRYVEKLEENIINAMGLLLR